jgi:hypothetical protein
MLPGDASARWIVYMPLRTMALVCAAEHLRETSCCNQSARQVTGDLKVTILAAVRLPSPKLSMMTGHFNVTWGYQRVL